MTINSHEIVNSRS